MLVGDSSEDDVGTGAPRPPEKEEFFPQVGGLFQLEHNTCHSKIM